MLPTRQQTSVSYSARCWASSFTALELEQAGLSLRQRLIDFRHVEGQKLVPGAADELSPRVLTPSQWVRAARFPATF